MIWYLRRWRVAPEFNPRDLWVGVYWAGDRRRMDVWVCLVPCLPLHFRLR